MTSEALLREAEAIQDHVLRERRTLHQCPGTGFDIGDTLAFVRQELTDMGLQPVECGRAGLVALVGGKRPGKVFLCLFGALAALLIYGGIMNPASVLMYQSYPTWEMIAAAYLTGILVDAVHAVSTAFFLWVFARPFLEKVERVRTKYGLME